MILTLSLSTLLPYTVFFLFFFNDTATTEIYTLSLHDALPICAEHVEHLALALGLDQVEHVLVDQGGEDDGLVAFRLDRKSTRLNSSHLGISYAVFCLKTEDHTSELQSLRHLVCRLLHLKTEHV